MGLPYNIHSTKLDINKELGFQEDGLPANSPPDKRPTILGQQKSAITSESAPVFFKRGSPAEEAFNKMHAGKNTRSTGNGDSSSVSPPNSPPVGGQSSANNRDKKEREV